MATRLRAPHRSSRDLLDVGVTPDYRFTLANERTFLAWVRTSLALTGAGMALVQLAPQVFNEPTRRAISAALIGLGLLAAGSAYRRWERNERAIRLDQPLTPSMTAPYISLGLGLVAALCLVGLMAPTFR
jgi:putative membrane protein